MKTVWIVEGSTGEYSDRREWPVCAFTTEEKAKELVEELSGLARVAEQAGLNRDDDLWRDETPEFKKLQQKDPRASIDYTGTHYTAYPVEVRE